MYFFTCRTVLKEYNGFVKCKCLLKNTFSKQCLTFCKEYYSCSNDHSMESYCAFLQKDHPCFTNTHTHIHINHIIIYIKRFGLVQELKQCHTLSQGLLCALKATFSKECHTLLKAILCIHCIHVKTSPTILTPSYFFPMGKAICMLDPSYVKNRAPEDLHLGGVESP